MRPQALLLALLLTAPALCAQTDTPADKSAFAALDKSVESAPPAQRLAYNALLVTFITFRDAHVRHEVCFATAACAQPRVAERARLNQEFLRMANGAMTPSFTSEDLTSADSSLNSQFNWVTGVLTDSCSTPDCLSKSAFQEVERDWIRYRDAWLTFASLRFPQVTSESWRTYLTRQRLIQLQPLGTVG